MRASDGVEAVFLQLQQLVAPQLIGHSRTYAGMVEVKVATLQLDAIAVEQESLPGVEVRGTDTYPDIILVQEILNAVISFVKAGPESIEIWIVN